MIDIKELDSYVNDWYGYDIFKICDRAKSALISSSFVFDKLPLFYLFEFEEEIVKMTPIEQIFTIAYLCLSSNLDNESIISLLKNSLKIPFQMVLCEELVPQKEIIYKDKKYRVDFCIDFSRKDNLNEYVYENFNGLKYVVELDGFEYHSSKQQMSNDYERDLNLQSLGYKVIRFTGSQVYKKPYECVSKVIQIIISDMLEELKKRGEYGR